MNVSSSFPVSAHLAAVDKVHHFNVNNYLVQVHTIADAQHNCSVLGKSELSFIREAERMGFEHEYACALKDATTKKECFLVLKKLFDRQLYDTVVFRRCIRKIAMLSKTSAEFQELYHAVSFRSEFGDIVKNLELISAR